MQPFGKRAPGNPLEFYAAELNAWNQAHRDRTAGGLGADLQKQGGSPWGIPVKNDTGQDLNRFDVVRSDGVIIEPWEDVGSFSNSPWMSVALAAAGTWEDFGVMLTNTPDGAAGRALFGGISPAVVAIDTADEADDRAKPVSGQVYLQSERYGPAEILYKEPIGYRATGPGLTLARCLVRWPAPHRPDSLEARCGSNLVSAVPLANQQLIDWVEFADPCGSFTITGTANKDIQFNRDGLYVIICATQGELGDTSNGYVGWSHDLWYDRGAGYLPISGSSAQCSEEFTFTSGNTLDAWTHHMTSAALLSAYAGDLLGVFCSKYTPAPDHYVFGTLTIHRIG